MNIVHVGQEAGPVESRRFFRIQDQGHVVSLRHQRIAVVFSWGAAAQGPASSSAISYSRDIQPIFTEKCVACHACNDAACQLNLGSGEGAARGATKVPVYDGDRRTAVAPTRIFYDASGKQAWQQKGFYSVLDAQGSQAR